MHPLVAIGLVFLAATAWTVTILTMLIVLVEARREESPEARRLSKDAERVSSRES